MERIERYRATHAMTNTTSRYLLVADHHEVLSDHETEAEALAAGQSLVEPGCASWEVLAPGQTTSGELEGAIIWDDGRPDPIVNDPNFIAFMGSQP